MRSNLKIPLLIGLTLAVIICLWLVALKFNLQNSWQNKEKQNGLSLNQLIDEIGKIVQNSPLSKKSESGQNQLNDLSQKIAEKIKTYQETLNTATENWQTYQNKEYNFEFKYPGDWPTPSTLQKGNWPSDGGYPAKENSKWKLEIGGLIKGLCEGTDCYQFYFNGYSAKDYNTVVNELKNTDLIKILEQTTINESRVVIYNEGGICENKTALIFGQNQTIKFTGH